MEHVRPGRVVAHAPARDAGADTSTNPLSGVSAASRTSTTTVIGRHEHTISGYSLLKGIGDGEPIASDRFMVGGHEWVLLFYPDGKRSMSDANAPSAPQDDPYAALFVALIGEGPRPLGVVQSGQGRVVRAFHRFTLVDQSGNGRHITKGRQREQGAVKISCARQDPQARNCHGYRKFVRRSVLEASGSGYLVNDIVVIRYEIELVVTSGGALNKNAKLVPAASVNVPSYPTIGKQLISLLYDPDGNFDCTFDVEGEKFRAHKLILSSRSSVFAAMLRTGAAMKEGRDGVVTLRDIKPDVFRLLLHFVYADEIPRGGVEDACGDGCLQRGVSLEGDDLAMTVGDDFNGASSMSKSGRASDEVALDVPMTQHLLVAADRFDLSRLRAMCEARLCDSVDVSTVANTLMLAELNHAQALKRACMGFIAANLSDVMSTEGYDAMNGSCPHLASEILSAVAEMRPVPRTQGVPLLGTPESVLPLHAPSPSAAAAAVAAVAAAAARAETPQAGGVLAAPPTLPSSLAHAHVHDVTNLSFPAMSTLSTFLSRVPTNLGAPSSQLGVIDTGTARADGAGQRQEVLGTRPRDAALFALVRNEAQRDIGENFEDFQPPPDGLVEFTAPYAAGVQAQHENVDDEGDDDAGDGTGTEGRRVRPRR